MGGDDDLYRYVANNPVNFVDPDGLQVLDPGCFSGNCFRPAPRTGGGRGSIRTPINPTERPGKITNKDLIDGLKDKGAKEAGKQAGEALKEFFREEGISCPVDPPSPDKGIDPSFSQAVPFNPSLIDLFEGNF